MLCVVLQALHSLGLRVVLDVVYNHTFASGPYSQNSVLVSCITKALSSRAAAV
jgi:pullulanase/glycogen debranching enzyme